MEQPLSGVRVVELAEGVAGPYAGKLLADYGADVVKVEPPQGDVSRTLGPFPGDEPDPEQSALFLHVNTNKRSVVLDLEQPTDRARVADLVAASDVVIESFPPGALERWGLGYDDLRARNDDLVLTSVTAFGQDGPYAGYAIEDIVAYAMGGPMNVTGVAEREPVQVRGAMVAYQCATVAATATMAAVLVAEAGGGGTHVDVSRFETQAGSIDRRLAALVTHAYTGGVGARLPQTRHAAAPNGIFPTADGWVQVTTINAWVPRMLKTLGDAELAERYQHPGWMLDPELPELMDAVLYPWLLSHTKAECMALAQANGWPVTAVNAPAEVIASPHMRERGTMAEVDHRAAGRIAVPGAPFRMECGWSLRRPAPLLGEHTDEVLSALAAPGGGPDVATLPLEGVRVLDLTVVWAGPYATMVLADLGAEIIRLDNPWLYPSSTRGLGPPRMTQDQARAIGGLVGAYPGFDPGPRPWNRHALFNCHARGKRIATLDLRRPLGRETFLRLVDVSDVVIENNAAKTLDQLDLGLDVLRARKPELIAVRMAPLGLSGPWREIIGFGANFEAVVGLTAVRGYHDADPSSTTSTFHMDPASGAAGAFAVLAALRRRRRTGEGASIELAQGENVMHHIGELFVDAARTGRIHEPVGNRSATRAPQGCYRCAGDDRWVVISVGSDEAWAGLRRAMGDPAWAADARYASLGGRLASHDAIDEGIEAWTSALDRHEVFHRCQAEGVAAGPVMDEADATTDPHLRARGFFRENSATDAGVHEYPGHLWRWSGPDLAWGSIHAMGEDNEYVYKELLGMDDEEYAALGADGHLSLDYLDAEGRPL